MKRLLSLLVVIAMVVSMVPSVFAAKEDVDFDELTGRLVVLEDIGSFEVALAEGSDGMIYQWTPAADEEATALTLYYYPEDGIALNVTATTGETTVAGGANSLELPIVAGQLVEIEVSEANGAAATLNISGILQYPAGHEQNPYWLYNETEEFEIAANSYFSTRHTGTVAIVGEGDFNVIYNEETIAAVEGKVEIEVAASMGTYNTFVIDAAGTYTITQIAPIGTRENPEVLFRPNYIAVNLEAGNNQGYYYKWTANAAGTLKLTCPAVEGVEYDVNMTNMTTYAQAWLQDSTDGTVSLAVSAGNEVIIQVAALPDASWNIPALQTAITGEFIFPEGTQSNPEVLTSIESIAVDVEAGNNQGYYYTWTATETGTLVLTPAIEGVEYDVNMTNMTTYAQAWLQDSTDGTIALEVTAGDQVIIQVAGLPDASWNIPAVAGTIAGELVLPTPELTITAQPQDTLVVLGTPGAMTVEVEGEVKSYKWEISTDGGTTWKNTSISGYNTNTLNVPGTAVRHKAMFRCVITPVEGEAITSEAATHYVAFLEVTPADQKVKTNETATFTAKWSVDGATYSWQYKKNGTEGAEWIDCTSSIASGRLTDTITSQAKANRNLFGFRCVITYNGETYYSCEDSDKGARILICEEAAEITSQPESQTVRSGDRAVFTVEAAGTGVTYQWQVKKPTSGWFNTSMTGYNTNTLTVRAYDVRNGYQYKCRIRTPNGAYTIDVYTEPVTLTILPAADIIEQPTNTTVAVGENAVFSVQAEGEGLTYQWQVSTNGGTTFRNLNSGTGLQTPELTVQATASRNGYYYRCMIMNKFYDGVGYGSMYTDKVKLTVTTE